MPVWYLVPDGVVQYIEKRGLYREAPRRPGDGRRRGAAATPPCRPGDGARPPPTTETQLPGGTPMTASAEARETALLAAQAAADKLATDVSIVDVSDRLAITDAFVLASAPNERQVQSIVDAVEERLREHGIKPVRREGVAESRWVLLDFVDVVVHVQHAEERAYYALERLWKDCPTIPFVDRARRRPTAGRRGRARRGRRRPVSGALPVLPVPRLLLWRHGRTEWNADRPLPGPARSAARRRRARPGRPRRAAPGRRRAAARATPSSSPAT